jgi:hypothetical protein
MRPNLMEHWWQNESAQIEERAATAAALRHARHSARSRRRDRTRQLLGAFANRWRRPRPHPVGALVRATDENRG